MTLSYTLLSILAVSLASLGGALFLAMRESTVRRFLLLFVSFSTGALLAAVFLHLLPEITENAHESAAPFALVLGGVLFSFIIEKFIHWRHCHSLDCDEHVHAAGTLVLIGDAVHNVVDGMLIATSYMVSVPVGLATTLAVFLHEVPQELGDFGVLLHSGYSRKRALLFNFLSALTAFIGAFLVFGLSEVAEGIEHILLPIAAGNFLYIAGADLIPELHKEMRLKSAVQQLIAMLIGIGLIASVLWFSPEHEHQQEEEMHNEIAIPQEAIGHIEVNLR